MAKCELTMLSDMAGPDFEAGLDWLLEQNVRQLDLKGGIYGKMLLDLTDDEAQQAATAIAARGQQVYCFSTCLFKAPVEMGEEEFRKTQFGPLQRILELAAVLKPQVIRLLVADTDKRGDIKNAIDYVQQEHSWLLPLYGEAIDLIAEAGFQATIENEIGGCLLATPKEAVQFFNALGRRDKVCMTWDVQNLWQMGTFPSLDVYEQFKPYLGYFHVKGGMTANGETSLKWRSTLEDASWPVIDITQRVVTDGLSPVICLNPSHGQGKPDYDQSNMTERDLAFLRANIPEIS